MKKLMIGIGLMSFSFFMNAQIGLKSGIGTELFLVKNIEVQAIRKIDFTISKKKKGVVPNLHPTWSFSESNVYDNHFGFFCKMEVELGKMTDIQPRFRLGSLDYVNRLETKPTFASTVLYTVLTDWLDLFSN